MRFKEHLKDIPFLSQVMFTYILAFALAFALCVPAFADEAADAESTQSQEEVDALRAQANAIFSSIDSLQSDLNSASAEYGEAVAEHNEALKAMLDAEARMKEADKKMSELHVQLEDMAATMYKSDKIGAGSQYLNVLLGASSFSDFVSGWDMMTRVSGNNAELLAEVKAVREEAAAATIEYEEQKKIAADRMKQAQERQLQIATKQAQLTSQAAQITGEIEEAQAQADLEAEAARKAEEAAKAAAAAFAASLSAGESVDFGEGYFANPCPEATESSGWGYRDFDKKFHLGTDMAAPMGTPFYAAEAGTVIAATYDGGYHGGAGNWVVISHGNGLVTKYMHASAVFVSVGDTVERGQNIGAVGSTGRSTGPHLHFQVEVDGVAICPYNYL